MASSIANAEQRKRPEFGKIYQINTTLARGRAVRGCETVAVAVLHEGKPARDAVAGQPLVHPDTIVEAPHGAVFLLRHIPGSVQKTHGLGQQARVMFIDKDHHPDSWVATEHGIEAPLRDFSHMGITAELDETEHPVQALTEVDDDIVLRDIHTCMPVEPVRRIAA